VRLLGHRNAGEVEVLLPADGLDTVVDVVGDLTLPEEILLRAAHLCSLVACARGVIASVLTQRAGDECIGAAVVRLALPSRDQNLGRAFFGGVGVQAVAFAIALALAELVGGLLAVGPAIRRGRAGHAPRHHGGRLRQARQIVHGLARAFDRRQDRGQLVEQLAHFVDQPGIFLARRGSGRRWRWSGLWRLIPETGCRRRSLPT